MRRSMGLIAIVLGGTLISAGSTGAAETTAGTVKNTPTPAATAPDSTTPAPAAESAVTVRTHENLDATPEEKQKAAAAAHAASTEEQQVSGRVRGLQLLMQKEEQDLAKRLAYAAKVRAAGLSKNDQKLLDQAEGLERQALDYYQKRVQQFEAARVSTGSSTPSVTKPAQPRTYRQPTPAYRSSRSPSPPTRYRPRR